jgi:dTDP-4-dehydrorhamnose reductase
VHLDCTREEQLRWFKEVWDSCCTLKKDGLDIKAVTAWSLFGAFGWNTLLTKPECDYEPGVFDLRSSSPRPTALAKMIYAYSSGKQFHHPLLLHPGWWKRKGRFINQIDQYSVIEPLDDINCAPLLIIGNESILKNAFVHICRSRCIPFVLRDMDQMDLSTDNKINTAVSVIKPWAIIDISWYAGNKDACASDMTGYSAALARHCINNNIRLINFSSPYVFNGNQSRPYIESDKPDARNDYGKYIAHLEEVVLKQNPESLIVRTGHLLSVTDAENFIHAVCDTLKQGKVLNVSNVLISSAYVPHLVNNVMDLLIDEEKGILHITNSGALSWYDLALDICRRSGYSAGLIIPVNDDNINQAPVIESERTWIMPSVTCALNNFFPHHDSNNAAKELYLQNNDR